MESNVRYLSPYPQHNTTVNFSKAAGVLIETNAAHPVVMPMLNDSTLPSFLNVSSSGLFSKCERTDADTDADWYCPTDYQCLPQESLCFINLTASLIDGSHSKKSHNSNNTRRTQNITMCEDLLSQTSLVEVVTDRFGDALLGVYRLTSLRVSVGMIALQFALFAVIWGCRGYHLAETYEFIYYDDTPSLER